jgi:hypothetical protein
MTVYHTRHENLFVDFVWLYGVVRQLLVKKVNKKEAS